MEDQTPVNDNWKEDKRKLEVAILSLKKEMKEYKKERKSEWKAMKSRFSDTMDNIEKSLKELKTSRKNKEQ